MLGLTQSLSRAYDKESATLRPRPCQLAFATLTPYAVAVGVAVLILAACVPASPAHAATQSVPPVRAATHAARPDRCPVTYVAIGASDAVGIGADGLDQGWPSVLAGWLPRGSRLIDLGVPGITLARARDVELPVALDALSTTTRPHACSGRTGLATVWLAVNDVAARVSLASYAANLQAVLSALHAHTRATVLVGNLPDLALVPAFRDREPPVQLANIVAAWNRVIAATARRNGARLVDLYSGWRDLAAHPEYIGPDGLHPTPAGYRVLAGLFRRALR